MGQPNPDSSRQSQTLGPARRPARNALRDASPADADSASAPLAGIGRRARITRITVDRAISPRIRYVRGKQRSIVHPASDRFHARFDEVFDVVTWLSQSAMGYGWKIADSHHAGRRPSGRRP
jgi:hypothetical protein